MIKFDTNTNIWVTSDTHYNHKNICRGVTDWRTQDGSIPEKQTRNFSNLEKMNNAIVNNINEVVGQDDVLIHLGDWSFGGFEKIQEYWEITTNTSKTTEKVSVIYSKRFLIMK
jgi:calcineurin-like phosphoesterase family protein